MLYYISTATEKAITSCYNNEMELNSILYHHSPSADGEATVPYNYDIQKKLSNVNMAEHSVWIETFKQTTVDTRPELIKYYIKRLQRCSIVHKDVHDCSNMAEYIAVWQYYQPLMNDKLASQIIHKLKKDEVREADKIRAPDLTYLEGLVISDSTAFQLATILIDIAIDRSNTTRDDPLHEIWDAKISYRDKNNIPVSIEYTVTMLNKMYSSFNILMKHMSLEHQENIQLKLIYLSGNSQLVDKVPYLKKYQTVMSLLDHNSSISAHLHQIEQLTARVQCIDTPTPLPEL